MEEEAWCTQKPPKVYPRAPITSIVNSNGLFISFCPIDEFVYKKIPVRKPAHFPKNGRSTN